MTTINALKRLHRLRQYLRGRYRPLTSYISYRLPSFHLYSFVLLQLLFIPGQLDGEVDKTKSGNGDVRSNWPFYIVAQNADIGVSSS